MQPDDPARLAYGARELPCAFLAPFRAGGVVCLVVFAISASLALGWSKVRGAQSVTPPARVAVWLCDRDGDRVFGLDRDLLVVNSVALRAPTEVEARPDGGAWIVSSINADPLGQHRLLRMLHDGTLAARAQLGPILDLDCDELGRAIVVDIAGAGARVSAFDANASAVWTRAWPGALCAAAAAGHCLVGTQAGELDLFDLNAPLLAPLRLNFGGAISDVAPGPSAGSWWALDANGACRLALFDMNLSVIWSRTVGLHALHLAPIAGVERVWIADTTQPYVRRFGPGGVLEVDRQNMPQGGLDRGCSAFQGSVLFPAPGALLRLDGLGQSSPGQAGFDFLVDVAAVHS